MWNVYIIASTWKSVYHKLKIFLAFFGMTMLIKMSHNNDILISTFILIHYQPIKELPFLCSNLHYNLGPVA